MNLSNEMRGIFIDELRFVVEKMKESKSVAEKMYFFSAAYGAAHRIMNIEYDDELAFIHNVLNASYATINGRVTLTQGGEMVIGIPEKLFDRIEEALEEIIGMVQEGQETYPALQKISNAAYSTTGNGYYLYLKGKLII